MFARRALTHTQYNCIQVWPLFNSTWCNEPHFHSNDLLHPQLLFAHALLVSLTYTHLATSVTSCLTQRSLGQLHTHLPCQSLFLLHSVDLANYRPYLWVRIMRLHTEQILSCLCNEIWVELRCRCGRGGGQTHSRSWHVICSPSLRLTFQEIAFQWRREQRSQWQCHTHTHTHTHTLPFCLSPSLSVLWQPFWFMTPIPWCRCSLHS